MEQYDICDDMEFSQRLIDRLQRIGNIKDLRAKLSAIPDSYEGFVSGILRYATTSRCRKEKVMNYLEQNPQATCSQVTEYVVKQPDFHDAAKQTELELKLYKVNDFYDDLQNSPDKPSFQIHAEHQKTRRVIKRLFQIKKLVGCLFLWKLLAYKNHKLV